MKTINQLALFTMFISSLVFAQSPETKEKLENLKGDVTKITIETTDGELVLTGDDAKAVLSKMNKHKNSNFIFIDDAGKTKEIKVDVDIEDSNGEKVVIIKKNIDGEEIIEEYRGEAAEQHIIKMKGDHGMKFISEHGDVHMIVKDDDDFEWISDNDKDLVKKEVEVEVVDGTTKVTITTTENGEEKTEVLEGEKAEKYLQDMENEVGEISVKKDGDEKIVKKKIIIKKEEKQEDPDSE